MKLNKRRISSLALTSILLGGVLSNISAESVTDKDRTLVISPGEYPNKPGKRSSVANEVVMDKKKYPTYKDGTLGEYYINKPFVEKISEYVRAKDNTINVVEYYRKGKSDDLNAMGKIAKENKGDIYLSIHTNFNDSKNKSGFLAMTSTYNKEYKNESDKLANTLVEALKDNQVPIKPDRGTGLALNETKIGELNKSMEHMPAVLLELGYYSNPDDLQVLTSDTYINTISNRIAEAIVDEFHTGNYDKDQADEKVITSTKKKDEKVKEVKPEVEQTIEPPKEETPEVENIENIEDVEIDNVEEVEETEEESKGLLGGIFNKDEEVEEEVIEEPSEPEKPLEEMSLEEVEVEYQRALNELRALRDEL